MGLIASFNDFLMVRKEIQRFKELPKEKRELVFFAETPHDWVHFEGMIKNLVEVWKRPLTYLTSSRLDPILKEHHPLITPFYLGEGSLRTIFFQTIEAKVVVMALIDFNHFFIKRSIHPVHYICVLNSPVSTHMVARHGAYDHFDTLFTVGPHQTDEVLLSERHYQKSKKKIVNVGFQRLDSLIQLANLLPKPPTAPPIRVLIAPSWGPTSITELCSEELISVLLNHHYHVTMRPHPMSVKQNPNIIKKIEKMFGNHSDFCLELDVRSKDSLAISHIMISDWSGAAIEYSFAFKRPVLYINTPLKVMNERYKEIESTPIEVSIRKKIGDVVELDQIKSIPSIIDKLCLVEAKTENDFVSLREQHIYNVGKSGHVAAESIASYMQN